ncbi:type 2 periplasmic-binding domain-containing protein [Dongshaea marina]|uniref:hypothetical protein n=1 Tax=Dongshaea marina TaxID=2047966 RepID=UPI000D3EB8FF|nr:hypothetical protein [Dongshaea marina]
MQKRLCQLLLTCLLSLAPDLTRGPAATEFRMFASDWPVWMASRAMHRMSMLPPEFNYYFKTYNTNVERFKDGVADVAFLTLYDFIYTQSNQHNGVIIGITDYSNGGDKIMARQGLKMPDDLFGKSWVLQSNSISLWLAHLYLKQHGKSLDDIYLKYAVGENVGELFVHLPSLAAAVGWNPNLDMVTPEVGQLVATSKDFPENIYDVIVVQKSALAENRPAFKALLRAWYKGMQDPRVPRNIAKYDKIPEKTYAHWLEDAYIFRSVTEATTQIPRIKSVAKEVLNFFNSIPPKSLRRRATIAMFGVQSGVTPDSMFDFSLLKELAAEETNSKTPQSN